MNALTYISGMSLLAAALTTTVLSPAESSGPRSGMRLGDMGRDTVLYTKEQADIVFAAQSGSVPTNMSQLVDDVGYAKTNDIPVNVSQLANDAGYLTGHQSLEGYARTNDIPVNVSQLANDAGYLTGHQSLEGYARTNDIPVLVSQLVNDAGYVTAEQITDIVAEAVRAAVGPFAIVEDEDGAVVLVRRADGVSGGGSVTNGQSGSTGGSTQE